VGNFSDPCVVCDGVVGEDNLGFFVMGRKEGWTCKQCSDRLYSVPLPQSEQRCENCRFAGIHNSGLHCKRYPMVWTGDKDDGITCWRWPPISPANQWCGEWKEREKS